MLNTRYAFNLQSWPNCSGLPRSKAGLHPHSFPHTIGNLSTGRFWGDGDVYKRASLGNRAPSYGAFLVSKFKLSIQTFDPSIQTCNCSVQTFNPSIQICNCSVQTFDPSIQTFNPSVQKWNGSIQTFHHSIQIWNCLFQTFDSSIQTPFSSIQKCHSSS